MNFISRITFNKAEQKNIISMICRDSFSTLSTTMVGIVPAFLLKLGVNDFQFGLINTLSSIAFILGMFLFMGRVDSICSKKIIKTNKNLYLLISIYPVSLMLLSILGNRTSILGIFIAAACSGLVYNFFMAVRTMTTTRILKQLFVSNIYGTVSGLNGVIYSIAGIIGGVAIKPLIENYEGTFGFGMVFFISFLAAVISAYFSDKVSLLRDQEGDEKKFSFKVFFHALKTKELTNLLILHTLRGIISGIVIFILPLGVKHYNIPLSYNAYIVAINAAAGIIGSIFINMFFDRIGTLNSNIAAVIIILFSLGGMIAVKSQESFLLFYSLFYIGEMIIGIAIPLGVLRVIPSSFIGAFTGMRLFIMKVSEAIIAFTVGLLINAVSMNSILITMLFIVSLQLWFAKKAFVNEKA